MPPRGIVNWSGRWICPKDFSAHDVDMVMMTTAIASNRFGLGARADDRAISDTKRGLIAQLGRFEAKPVAYASAPTRVAVANELADYLETVRGLRMNGDGKDDAAKPEMKAARKMARVAGREAYVALVGARMNAALTTPAPFVERLVHFWANHFAVSADKLAVIGAAGLLEVEAIRPHVLGKFSEMLMAVEQHPAMLLYLDQAQSVGPDSPIGARVAARGKRKIGLNENLAREILELHTLGVRTGYTQADVTEFARAMTGWTVAGVTRGPMQRFLGNAAPGDFAFVPQLHQPGDRTIMGRRYAEGAWQAKAVLLDLAAHPATATHIATKLARHFTGDVPPPALVERLANAFLTSDGDLPSVYRVLIDAPEVWAAAPKFKSPWDWSVSALRAVGVTLIDGQQAAAMLTQLGQPVWRPGSPAGFDDVDATWAGPDALFRRVETAGRLATRGGGLDARRTAEVVLAGSMTPATASAITRCESPAEGLALMLVCPEFMRR
jgi:uncharacterized protein (DUF1800 family)